MELCLHALKEQGLEKNVILVDDCYKQSLPDFAKHFKSVRNKTNLGFGRTCNVGAQRTTAPVIVFLNSDVVMLDGWHESMLQVFNGDLEQRIAIQGGKLMFPPDSTDPTRPAGKIQHAGIIFPPNKMPTHAFIGWSSDNPRVDRPFQVQAVTGALLAIRRSVFNTLKGFDPVYGKGTYEDIDLCLRCCEMGKAVMYNHQMQGYHRVGSSGEQFPLNDNHYTYLSRHRNNVIWDEWAIL